MLKEFPISKILPSSFPKELLEIPTPPKELFVRGEIPSPEFLRLAVVGSRKYTPYGKEVTKKLIEGLRGYPVAIVSGLALGIDGVAHEAALSAGLPTIAIPGSGLNEDVLYPRNNLPLAKRILENGGCLISELAPEEKAAPWTFPLRNRIMAGLSKAILVIEAEKVSGTLITARLGTEYNKDILTVPGSIFQSSSEGPHLLLKLGATPIRESSDILEALGIEIEKKGETKNLFKECSPEELLIINELTVPKSRDDLKEVLNLNISQINTTLTLLEIKGIIKEVGGKIFLS